MCVFRAPNADQEKHRISPNSQKMNQWKSERGEDAEHARSRGERTKNISHSAPASGRQQRQRQNDRRQQNHGHTQAIDGKG